MIFYSESQLSTEKLTVLNFMFIRCLTQYFEKPDQRKNFLHPDAAVATSGQLANSNIPGPASSPCPAPPSLYPLPPPSQSSSPPLTHSRSVPTSSGTYHWPPSPVLPSISSRTPRLIPETLSPTLPDSSWDFVL